MHERQIVMKDSTTIIHRAVIETLESRRLLSLAAPSSYDVGTNPVAVATGDLNGDGRSDVVTANAGGIGGDVSVLLSNADGTLQPAQHVAAGASPRSVAVGDFNNDGKRDIVTTSPGGGGGTVSVLLGNGNGTFQAAQSFTLPPQMPPGYTGSMPLPQVPLSVAVGDLNADGKLDLVVNGRTTFFVPYISPYGGTRYYQVDHTHVNVLIGNGSGSFAPVYAYPQAYLTDSLALGDFNRDNKLDVLLFPGGRVTFMAGTGDGTLQPPLFSASLGNGQPLVGDFNGDAKLDFVARVGDGISFIKGMGDGTFVFGATVSTAGSVRSLAVGDMNADGTLDLVASTWKTTFESYGYSGGYNPTTIESSKVLLGFGDGTFSRGVSSTVRSYADYVSSSTNASALGDFNADGRPDLVATDPANHKVFTQLNQPGWIIPGTVALSDAAMVTEGNTGTVNAVFTVTLNDAPSPAANVLVNYAVVDGSATLAGGDFLANTGTLTFTPGQTSKTIIVQVKGDRVGEDTEDFFVRLTDATNADITDDRGIGGIIDDEPRIWFTGGSVTEGDSGTKPVLFTATLSAPSDAPVTVNYQTADSNPTDYVPATGTLTIAPGQTTQTFTVLVNGDLIPEYTEYVYVNFTSATNALIIGSPGAAGAIIDTDPDPTISIANVTRAEGGPGTQTGFEFIVSLSMLSEKVVSVHFVTGGGTATSSGPNKDYNAESNFASIYPGQIFGIASVYIIGDNRNESDETFFVNLSNPDAATIADNQAVGTILDDESRGKTWVGPASGGNWSTASNWSPSGVPSASSLVSITGASVTVSSSVNVAEISLNEDAVLTLAPNGNRVLRTSGLYFGYHSGYPTLNLNDNDLIVDYTAAAGNISPLGVWNRWNYSGITGMIQTGRNGGQWNGWGIVTTRPDALSGRTALGIGEASDVLGLSGSQTALFSGQTVDATTVLVKYTYVGDANLDGMVSIADFITLASNFNKTNAIYTDGDLNYDGQITIADFIDLAANFNKTLAASASQPQPPAAESISVVRDDSTNVLDPPTAPNRGKPQPRSATQPPPPRRMHHRGPRRFRMLI
jgi:hypothetical protein